MRKGWYVIPGLQRGDRSLSEQMTGVSPALSEAHGKTVLDLGAAEGLMGREFVRSGAASCHGIDAVADHLAVARGQCRNLPMTFQLVGLQEWALEKMSAGDVEQFDIVLALGVCHKLHDPGVGVTFAARSSRDLVLKRMHQRSNPKAGILTSKHHRENSCNVNEIMEREGFTLEKILPGPYEETVWWWRRTPG